MTDITRVGLDTSKSLFQLHGVNVAEQPVLRKQLRRSEMIKFFEKLQPVVVVLAKMAPTIRLHTTRNCARSNRNAARIILGMLRAIKSEHCAR